MQTLLDTPEHAELELGTPYDNFENDELSESESAELDRFRTVLGNEMKELVFTDKREELGVYHEKLKAIMSHHPNIHFKDPMQQLGWLQMLGRHLMDDDD